MQDEFAHCKEDYFRELDRKVVLTSALALPVGIATLVSSGLLYAAKFVGDVESRIELVIVLLITISGMSLLVAVFCLCKSYLGYTYRYIPAFADIRKYRHKLRIFHKNEADTDSLAISETTDYLLDIFSSSAQINFNNNNRKSAYIYLANRALVVAICLLLLAIIPIIFSEFNLSTEKVISIIKGS